MVRLSFTVDVVGAGTLEGEVAQDDVGAAAHVEDATLAHVAAVGGVAELDPGSP
jgi:hypothetical protein